MKVCNVPVQHLPTIEDQRGHGESFNILNENMFCSGTVLTTNHRGTKSKWRINYLLTYDSYVPLYNRFHRREWITRVSGGEGALDNPGPLNGT
jgi:hypothetical protein